MRFSSIIVLLFTIVIVFSVLINLVLSRAYSSDPVVFDRALFSRENFARAGTNAAWFVLDYVPRTYKDIIQMSHELSQLTVGDVLLPIQKYFRDLPRRIVDWFLSWLECPREETFLFFWSYPQTYYCAWYNQHYGRYRVISKLDTYIGVVVCLVLLLISGYSYAAYSFAMRFVRPWEDLAHLVASLVNGEAYCKDLSFYHCRKLFQTTPMPVQKPHANHSHGGVAAARAVSRAFIKGMISAIGHVPWSYQMSSNDQDEGLAGLRTAFWVKDLTSKPRNDPLEKKSAVMMIDVDYYMDLPRWLATNFRPHFLYTFQPTSAGLVAKEYSYSFMNNIVRYVVTGSSDVYEHPVWDFQHDNISVTRTFMGIPLARAAYHVERRFGEGDHEIVMLIPIKRWGILTAWLSSFFITESPLKQFDLKVGGHNRLTIHNKEGKFVSTAAEDSCDAITLPYALDHSLSQMAKLSKLDLAYPTVLQNLKRSGIDSEHGAATLTSFYRSKQDHNAGGRRSSVPLISHYQILGPQYDMNAKPSMVAFMEPLALPPFAPTQCVENEESMVKKRVTDVLHQDKEITLFMERMITEFVQEFIPDDVANTFVPQDNDYLRDKQKRPSQKRILEQTEFDCSEDVPLKSFMKKEAKTEPKPPRLITTFEGDTKADYSMFMYTFSEYLKTKEWYAFGKTPKKIAEDIMAMAMDAEQVAPSDGDTFDGRYSRVLRYLESRILSRFYAPEYQAEVHALHEKQFQRKAVTTNGVKYDTEDSRGSGSPETSNMNSVANKFIAYVARRLMDMTPRQAYDAPGMYGGDDGATFDVPAEKLITAARLVGQKYKSVDVMKGETFSFLSRMYNPAIWFGNPNSACTLKRTLSSFNATVSLPSKITPMMKLVEKCRAYRLSDANTPIIGDFVVAVMEAADNIAEVLDSPELDPIRTWNSRLDHEEQYPNLLTDEDLDWLDPPEGYDIDRFRDWVRYIRCSGESNAKKLLLYLNPPYCDARELPTTAAIPVAVNDTVLLPPTEAVVPPVVVPTPTPEKISPKKRDYVPCPECSAKGRPVKHSKEFCWNKLTPSEKRVQIAALAEKKAKPIRARH